jgi:hypothetical protein
LNKSSAINAISMGKASDMLINGTKNKQGIISSYVDLEFKLGDRTFNE